MHRFENTHPDLIAHLFIVILGPLYLLQQITEVPLKGDVMLVWLQLLVEVLVIRGVLLQDESAPCQQVR